MSDGEKAKLSAMIGSAHAQSMKAYSNQSGVTCDITEAECNAQTTLVFNGCSDSTYILKTYSAKIFIQNCENTSITIAPEAKVLTETVEVHRCIETKLAVSSRVGTLQIDQCIGERKNKNTQLHWGRELLHAAHTPTHPSLSLSLFPSLPPLSARNHKPNPLSLSSSSLFLQTVRPPSRQTNASGTRR